MDCKVKLDSATIITKVLQYANNVDFDKFRHDFAEATGTFVSVGYADEKMTEMRGDFIRFFCNLDEATKQNFVTVALRHYGICE